MIKKGNIPKPEATVQMALHKFYKESYNPRAGKDLREISNQTTLPDQWMVLHLSTKW